MMGAKTVLVIGSNHILKYMISVATIPGSAQLTVVRWSVSLRANWRVNKGMARMGVHSALHTVLGDGASFLFEYAGVVHE